MHMKTARRGLVVLGIAASVLASPAIAFDEPVAEEKQVATIDEKAEAIWARSLKVQYGETAKTRSVKSMKLVGEMSMPAQGINASIEMLQSASAMAVTVDIPNLGQMREGHTGEHAWGFSELQGPSLKSAEESAQSKQQADIYAGLNWREYYSEIAYVGEQTIADYEGEQREVDVLSFLSVDGETTTKGYFDKESGRQIRTDAEVALPGGAKMPNTTLMADYRDVGGISMPFKVKTSVGPMLQMVTIKSVEVNPEIPADAFKVPAEVAALIEQQESAED